MVLEEEIFFINQDIAREFVKLLKEQGISSLIRQKSQLDIRLMLSGTYSRLDTMLDEVISADGACDEEIEIFSQTREHLVSQRDLIADAFKTYKIGDTIGSGDMDIITGDRTIEEDEKEEVLEKIIEEMYLIRLLHLNDLLKESEAGLVLAKTIEPNEAVLTVFADEIPMIPDEILSKHDITATITAGDDEEWVVTAGSEIILCEDLSPIEEFMEEYDIPEEELATFFPRLEIKQLLVSEILAHIRDGGKASREEIIEEFSERDIETKEGESKIALHLSKSYIDAVLDDLKKTGIIKGKDQKLKLAV
jgi:hypothetical protein